MGGNKNTRISDELSKRVKKLAIDDEDTSTETRVKSAFSQHFVCTTTANTAVKGVKGSQQGQVIYSDINVNEDRIFCGTTTGYVRAFNPTDLQNTNATSTFNLKHSGLSCVRCSKKTPEIVYSSSAEDGQILLWDFRQHGKSPAQTFAISKNIGIGGNGDSTSSSSSNLKPILTFDVSVNDQVVCGGTELINGEDSYILFWDTRSSKLLGAYWESHSDDVTAVKFHPNQVDSLVTGSTDGLVNIFSLKESNEEDALIFSLNTESSVDSLNWSIHNDGNAHSTMSTKHLPKSSVTCVTHTNEVQIWDSDQGDKFAHFDRQMLAKSMMRSNADAVHVNGCYRTTSNPLGILTCSLKGSCTRYMSVVGDTLQPTSLFVDHSAIVQTAQFISKANKWVTFDEDGGLREWSLTDSSLDYNVALESDSNTTDDFKPKKDRKVKQQRNKTKPYARS